jgi:uncharacterized protein YbjT (DUF2867 family)
MAAVRHVVVLGGSGFVGRHLVGRLSAAGQRVTVVTRRRYEARHLILLPTVQVVEDDPHDALALSRVFRDATAVVNLIGILHERGRDTFARVHVELVRGVVSAMQSSGATRLLHMSAQNADRSGPSRYLRSKGEAEAIVAGSGLAWTIFRPSVIFGREDSLLNLFAKLERRLPVLALAAPNARFQPVYVADVVECFARALADDATIGQRYALCGPNAYRLRDLVTYVGNVTGYARPIIPLGPRASACQARLLELLPGHLMSRDALASMQKDAVCDGPFPPVFGLTPTALEAVAPSYLAPEAVRSKYDPMRTQGGR